MWSTTRIAAGPLLVVLTTASTPAHAAYSYDAPAECPTRADFEAAVRARTTGAIPDDVAIDIVAEGDGHRGVLTVAGGQRELTIDRCDELVEALALSLALQLEREQRAREGEAFDPPPRAAPSADEEAIDETTGPAAAAGAPAPSSGEPIDGAAPAEGAFARIVGGVAVAAWFGRGRGVRPEPGIQIGVERVDGWWSLAASVSAWRLTSGELVDEGPGTGRFSIAAGRLTACPVGYDGGWWSAHPCLTFEVGRIDGEGQLDVPGRDDDSWLAGGLALWGTFRPVSPLAIQVGAGLATPFTRYRLRFDQPSRVIYELPALGGYVGGGVGLAWP